ncbi:MAG: hypothetical protein K2O74_01845 [Eubacteriales bacterium]|nr:hypothetical protein [Eubacteriales bacterium]
MSELKTVNLEAGRPAVPDALARLQMELRLTRGTRITALKLIHGFGSSGRGGKLRPAVRRFLDTQQGRGYLKFYIPGERLSIFNEETRRALDRCPALRSDPDLERHNNGITVVVL